MLKSEPVRAGEPIPPRELIVSDLVKRGAKDEAVQALNEILRNQNSPMEPHQVTGPGLTIPLEKTIERSCNLASSPGIRCRRPPVSARASTKLNYR